MSEDQAPKATAECPQCGQGVLLQSNALDRKYRCPRCKHVGVFVQVISDEERLRELASNTAEGVKKASRLAGGLFKKAAVLGISKVKEHNQRRKQTAEFREKVMRHLRMQRLNSDAIESIKRHIETLKISLSNENELGALAKEAIVRELIKASEEKNTDKGFEKTLIEYCSVFGCSKKLSSEVQATFNRIRRILAIESGKIKALDNSSGLVVRNSEIVWYESDGELIVKNRSGMETFHEGKLFVTNIRVVFTSRTNPNDIQTGNINAVEVEGNRLFLSCKTQRASSEFYLPEPEIAEAHIRRVVKIFHRQTDVGFEENSRRIPQEVKQAVWQRDEGCCVECGAKDYLEFDHIIPFSKGGANTVENLQLLCRRCNLKKSDRL